MRSSISGIISILHFFFISSHFIFPFLSSFLFPLDFTPMQYYWSLIEADWGWETQIGFEIVCCLNIIFDSGCCVIILFLYSSSLCVSLLYKDEIRSEEGKESNSNRCSLLTSEILIRSTKSTKYIFITYLLCDLVAVRLIKVPYTLFQVKFAVKTNLYGNR